MIEGAGGRAHPGVGVAGIAVREGRVLVGLRGRAPAAGVWAFPGGRLEPGESIVAAVRREILEECALEVEVGPRLEVVEAIAAPAAPTASPNEVGACVPAHHWVIIEHLVRVTGGRLSPGDDAADARWVSLAELSRLPRAPQVLRLAQRAVAHPWWHER
jgi:ADP-ribose pyrophosphatase YjhB (NUDIX family)